MTRFLHAWWPVAAVVAFTVALVLQIPRKALFFVPAVEADVEPFVSIIALDGASYVALVRRMRMSWQMRGRVLSTGTVDSRAAAFDAIDLPPVPDYLPRPPSAEAALPPPNLPLASLQPPSQEEAMPPISPPVAPRPDLDPALTALPEGFPAMDMLPVHTLENERNLK